MRLMFFILGLALLAGTAEAGDPIQDYAKRLREENAAMRNTHTGAVWSQAKKATDGAVKQPAKAPEAVKQPVKQPTKAPEAVKQPVKQPVKAPEAVKQPVKQPEVSKHHKPNPKKPHIDGSAHHLPPHHPAPAAPRKKTYVYTVAQPEVSYVVAGSGVVYQTNPHIYTANAYGCTMKGEVRYCTDSIGKPLTGRIVQDYTDSVAYENYKNGYLSGETSVYDLNGTLLQISNYSKGLKHGKETAYYANGRVHYVVHYRKGLINGEVLQYNINGVLVGQMQYKKGRYTSRYCRNGTASDLMRARIRENVKNELILCADD